MWGVEYSLGGTFGSTFHLLKISCILPKLTTRKQPRSLSLTFKHVKCPQENWIILFSTSDVIQFLQKKKKKLYYKAVFAFHNWSISRFTLSSLVPNFTCAISIRWVKLNVQNRQSHHRWVTEHLENVRELEWYICEDFYFMMGYLEIT